MLIFDSYWSTVVNISCIVLLPSRPVPPGPPPVLVFGNTLILSPDPRALYCGRFVSRVQIHRGVLPLRCNLLRRNCFRLRLLRQDQAQFLVCMPILL